MTFRPVPKPEPRPKAERKRPQRKPIRVGPPKVRDRAYLAWIKTLPCVAGPAMAEGYGNPCGFFPPGRPGWEPMHVKTKGSGGADRGNTVCGCPLHHDEQEGDTEGFEETYRVNLKLIAAELLVDYIRLGEP